MPDDAILALFKSIDGRLGMMQESFDVVIRDHKIEDDNKHEKFDDRIQSLERSRLAARTVLATSAIGGTTGAVKLGLLAKIAALLSGGTP